MAGCRTKNIRAIKSIKKNDRHSKKNTDRMFNYFGYPTTNG